ncbi:Lrp/AsnC family transcriptional regulator [Membranicola marinus]|uniref:Lrp/AsnC family transcriptional regulator n=1 Tax=Membranihabitans marinus TaxID=1227546 RepID=A0A953HT61_9BACT|nr:Lrp/AsnC family transcriptional regulator [Membranihabitans marinus]MBY5957950.1 Lrp/AsnC family transcriptional regulator [Membranihabitans marinus]
MDIKIDEFDQKIMEILQRNARTTIKEIAGEVGMSSTPVFERIKKLEKHGYIDRYVALLNEAKLGYKMVAFVQISLTLHNLDEVNAFVDRITAFPEVMECYHTTGESDFLVKILVRDMDRFNEFILYKLSEIENLGHVRTQFALSTRKRTTEIGFK